MSILFAILLLAFLILIHELGHFVAAKLSGVQVNEFAIFMGPAICKWKKGETQYSIRCIPIGGYCAMEGEDEESDNPRAYNKAKWWKRLIILAAGPGMNLVIGILISLILFLPAKTIITPQIESIEEYCTIEGLQEGDRILKIDGERVYNTSDFSMLLSLNKGNTYDLVVKRDNKKVVLNDTLMETHKVLNEYGKEEYLYGLVFHQKAATFGAKLTEAWYHTVDTIRMVRLSLQMLFTGRAGLKDMTGIVGIVDVMSESTQSAANTMDAVMTFLYFGGFISINLAVMNLLPFPALDGGRIVALLLTLVIEKITKKKLDSKYEAYVHGAGMVLLLILMVVILFKDVTVLFKR